MTSAWCKVATLRVSVATLHPLCYHVKNFGCNPGETNIFFLTKDFVGSILSMDL